VDGLDDLGVVDALQVDGGDAEVLWPSWRWITISSRFIEAVGRLARESSDVGESVGPLDPPGGGEGLTMRGPELPKPLHLFQRDGRVVMAYGDDAARDAVDPPGTLGDSAAFADAEAALGGDYAVSFYLAIAPVLELAESADYLLRTEVLRGRAGTTSLEDLEPGSGAAPPAALASARLGPPHRAWGDATRTAVGVRDATGERRAAAFLRIGPAAGGGNQA
jgi:hypothetical protein